MQPPTPSSGASGPPKAGGWAAFLLAQVGAHAASQFAQRLQPLELTPPHAGILRILASRPAITQQDLARHLGTLPSRLVALIDEMEAKGLVERKPNASDRRRYALHLTPKGNQSLEAVGGIGREHQSKLLAALSEEERQQLAFLLQRIADEQGLVRGVHPGFARGGRPASGDAAKKEFEESRL